MRIGHQGHPGLFKNGYCLFTRDGWKLLKKNIQRVTFFEIVKKILDRHSGSSEHRCSALDVWVNDDEGAGHGVPPRAVHVQKCTGGGLCWDLAALSNVV